jgi:hemerythrin-like domain-containing protein
MHAKAEEETLYHALTNTEHRDIRMEGLVAKHSYEVAFQVCDELREMKFTDEWSDLIEAKMIFFLELVKGHLRQDENAIFPIVRRHIGGGIFSGMAKNYLEKCKTFLNLETEAVPADLMTTMKKYY